MLTYAFIASVTNIFSPNRASGRNKLGLFMHFVVKTLAHEWNADTFLLEHLFTFAYVLLGQYLRRDAKYEMARGRWALSTSKV